MVEQFSFGEVFGQCVVVNGQKWLLVMGVVMMEIVGYYFFVGVGFVYDQYGCFCWCEFVQQVLEGF